MGLDVLKNDQSFEEAGASAVSGEQNDLEAVVDTLAKNPERG